MIFELGIGRAYLRARASERRFAGGTRERFLRWRDGRLQGHLRWLHDHSPHTRDRLAPARRADGTFDLDAVAPIDKTAMLTHFDRLVTEPVTLDEVLAVAHRAERSRDFAPVVRTAPGTELSVGLSSGTSGTRTVFVAGDAERAEWAGNVLARMRVPLVPREPLRIALLLRSGSNLYESVGSRRIQFRYFDFVRAGDTLEADLADFDPAVLIGPPSRLTGLARARLAGSLRLAPQRVVSVAEVLEPADRRVLERVWGRPVEEIYQASEGFLAYTCAAGSLHFDEDVVRIDREPLRDPAGPFNPIVTDFRRRTQPIVRYRLNDVVVPGGPCACGSPHQTLTAIAGRTDDLLRTPAGRAIYPDEVRHLFLAEGPGDYRIVQRADGSVDLTVVDAAEGPMLQQRLAALIERPVDLRQRTEPFPLAEAGGKLRRIRSELPAPPVPTPAVAPAPTEAERRFFDRIVYSSSNEDGASERRALALGPEDRVVTITGSGARAFELLLDPVGEVVAVDQNRHQTALAQLEVAAYRTLDYDAFLRFLGVRAQTDRRARYRSTVRSALPDPWREYWDAHPGLIDGGVVYAGTWESYFRWFARAARAKAPALRALFAARDLDEQRVVWNEQWRDWRWRTALRAFGMRSTWKYVLREPGIERIDPGMDIAAHFAELFDRCAERHLFRETPYLYLLFYGRYDPEGPFPAHLSAAGFETIRERLDRLTLVTESLSTLLARDTAGFDAFSLSDVSSYAPPAEHRAIWEAVARSARPGARVCERYFLADGAGDDVLPPGFVRDPALEARLRADDAAFIYRFLCARKAP